MTRPKRDVTNNITGNWIAVSNTVMNEEAHDVSNSRLDASLSSGRKSGVARRHIRDWLTVFTVEEQRSRPNSFRSCSA
jgi:hypothetical protein